MSQNLNYKDLPILQKAKTSKPISFDDLRDVNQRDICGCNALFWAINKKDTYNAKILIDNGSSLKVSQDQHALFEAIKEDAYEIVILLIKKGVSPNIIDTKGVTAFMYAIEQENFQMVSFLARHGADLFAMDDHYDMAQNYAQRCKNNAIKDFITHMLVVEFEKEQQSSSPCLVCATPCVTPPKEL